MSPWLTSPLRRALDVVVAVAGLAIAAPVLALAVLAIRLETAGSAVFRQQRVGQHGEAFELVKLRTMVTGAEHIGAQSMVNTGDARITCVGAVLRRFSIDELPNFVNILRGDMSLIGPRPTVQWQVDRYDARQRGRLQAKPGLTGWAQVNGRASLPWAERIELDLWYTEHASPWLDLKILLVSARLALTGADLYKGDTGGWRGPPTE